MSDHGSEVSDDDVDGEDLLAAEYALGVLDQEERAAAEARSDRDLVFAQDVFDWVARFAPLIDAVPEAEPSLALWRRILEATDPSVAAEPQPAPNDPTPRTPLLWRLWAVGASAVAAAALLVVALQSQGVFAPLSPHAAGAKARTLVATLGLTAGGASALTVAYDPGQATLYASPDADFSIPRSRAAELWLIPADGKPRPMGLIDASKPATMPMPPQFEALAREQATLALSIEPPGGSTTGQPTGPVIATGKLSAV